MPLFAAVTTDPARLSITYPYGSQRLEVVHDGEGWRVVAPAAAPAEARAIGAMLEIVRSLVGRPLNNVERTDWPTFGLDDSALVIEVEGSNGEQEQLLLGRVVPLDVGFVYALDPRRAQVYRVPAPMKEILSRQPQEYLDTRLAVFDPHDVVALVIRTGSTQITLEHDGEHWELIRPTRTPAADDVVAALLDSIATWRAREVVTDPDLISKLAELRFDYQVTVRAQSGRELTIAAAAHEGTTVVRVNPGGGFYLDGPERTAQLPRDPAAFESRAVLRFNTEQIRRVDVQQGALFTRLELEDGRWWFTQPYRLPANGAAVDRAMQQLLQLRLFERHDREAAQTRAVDSTANRIRLVDRAAGAHTLEVWTGPDGRLYGKSSFRDSPFAIDVPAELFLPLPLEALVDRRITAFEGSAVTDLELHAGREVIRVQRRGGPWEIVTPRRARAEQPAVWGIIFALESLEYDAILEPTRTPRGDRRIILRDSNGATLEELVIQADPTEVIVTTQGVPGTFRVAAELLERIPNAVEAIEFRR